MSSIFSFEPTDEKGLEYKESYRKNFELFIELDPDKEEALYQNIMDECSEIDHTTIKSIRACPIKVNIH